MQLELAPMSGSLALRATLLFWVLPLGSSKTLLPSQLSGLIRIWTLEWVLDTKQTCVAALDKLISFGEREEHCILRVRRDYG